jgi:GGDEF domain-containing protein
VTAGTGRHETSTWTAEFFDTAMEQAYRKHHQPALAEIKPDDEEIHDSIRRTDDALYEGKRNGRNCVISCKVA